MIKFHKIGLVSLKLIPMIIAFISFLNTILSYFYIDIPAFSYIVYVLLISYVYVCSYMFKFCAYHRMFLHYIVITTVINYIDYTYTIPLGLKEMILIQSILAVIFLFLILYLKFKICKKH